jgi:DNA-binding LacI/PurR family transcriptional regulator
MLKRNRSSRSTETITLRTVAEHVGLAPCSVSAILNDSAAAMSIPQRTKERVRRIASLLNYRPNYSARSLRTHRTYTVALLAPDLGHAPAARMAAGAEDFLRENGYCLLVAACDASPDWLHTHFPQLRQRGVEGVIAIQAKPPLPSGFPTAFLELRPVDVLEPTATVVQKRLAEAGRNAAKFLLTQIERSSTSRVRSTVVLGRQPRPETSLASRHQPSAHFAD